MVQEYIFRFKLSTITNWLYVENSVLNLKESQITINIFHNLEEYDLNRICQTFQGLAKKKKC